MISNYNCELFFSYAPVIALEQEAVSPTAVFSCGFVYGFLGCLHFQFAVRQTSVTTCFLCSHEHLLPLHGPDLTSE